MEQKCIIDLVTAKRVAEDAEAEADRNDWKVVIAIVDDAGHLMYLQREKVQLGRIETAIKKAKVALTYRRSTQLWEEMVDGGRYGYLNMPGMLPLEGGEPLVYEGEIVGAIGISGVKSNEDEVIAHAGATVL